MPEQNDREKLTVNYCPEHGDLIVNGGELKRSYRCEHGHSVYEIHASLAAPPVIDEDKLRRVIFDAWNLEAGDDIPFTSPKGRAKIARYLVEHRDEWLGGTR